MQANRNSASVSMAYKAIPETTPETWIPTAVRLRRGKMTVVIGTMISLIGIAIYCAPIFVEALQSDPGPFTAKGLSIIGVGVAIWLTGTVRYLNAAIDADKGDNSF